MSNIISIIFILASLGILFGYTNPLYRADTGSSDLEKKSVKELKQDITRYEQALERTREITEVRNGLLTKYNNVSEEERQRLNRLLPTSIDSVRLIIDVNGVANAYGMSLREIGISEPSSSQPTRVESQPAGNSGEGGDVPPTEMPVASVPRNYSKITMDFSVIGTYENILSFLSALEGGLRIVDITNLEISPDEAVGQTEAVSGKTSTQTKMPATNRYKANISLDTYYSPTK